MSTPRTTVKRKPERGRYDADTINSIIDEALICHVGFTDERGLPVVIPTIHARIGDVLYLHGSPASRMLRRLSEGVDVCVTITLLDGLVLARSVFHHSINYRSAVVFGTARLVTDIDEKIAAMRAVTEHIVPGRWEEARQPTNKEVAATAILRVGLDEASAKVRTGPPVDDDEDLALPVWAGVVPLVTTPGAPIRDTTVSASVETPASVRGLTSSARYSRSPA